MKTPKTLGGVIYIVGLYGAGKTTMVNAALDALPSLRNVPCFITRPPRPGEDDPRYECYFVTNEEYKKLRSQSKAWDHTEIMGISYGTDAEGVNKAIEQGQYFIVASPLNVVQLKEMQSYYIGNQCVIYIDTSEQVAERHLLERDGESAENKIGHNRELRIEAQEARLNADITFKPSLSLHRDSHEFVSLIRNIIKRLKKD